MPTVDRAVLKGYLERGDKPTQSQFATIIDSMVNIIEDRYLLGLREYDPMKQYLIGDTMVYNNALYQALATTTGVFDPVKWKVIASLGSVVYSGIWDVPANNPLLADGAGVKGYYYVVTVPGNRDLGSGTIDFQIGDWVIYNGTIWQKVDNSETPVVASNVAFIPSGSIISTNVQDAIEEVRDDADAELLLKADKVVGAILNDIPILDASGNLVDSGKKTTDFLPSNTVASGIPFTPNGDITSTNVQDAIVEVRNDADTKLSGKADKVAGAVLDDIAVLDASGNLVDGGKKLTDYLDKNNATVYTPTGNYNPATKLYVDGLIAGIPPQVKVVVIPLTFDTGYGTTSPTFIRIPNWAAVPASADVFPGATTISARLFVDYRTAIGNPTGEVAIAEYTFALPTTPTPLAGSTMALAGTSGAWVKIIGPAFTLTESKTYQAVFHKDVGSGPGQVQIEAATLILLYS